MKIKRKFLIVLAIISPFSVTGCFDVSTRVSAIGMHGYYGVVGNLDSQKVEFKIQDYGITRKSNGAWKMKWNTYIPYIDIQPGTELGSVIGEINGASAIETYKMPGSLEGFWTQGQVDGSINGNCVKFLYDNCHKPSNSPNAYVLKGRDRAWYGYPAQVLLVATIPIDLILNILKTPVYLIFG